MHKREDIAQDKRAERRSVVSTTVHYSYSFLKDQELRCAVGQGISVNVSPSGLCFYAPQMFQEGQDLKVYSPRLWEAPRAAVVRYCLRVNGELYRVGLSLS